MAEAKACCCCDEPDFRESAERLEEIVAVEDVEEVDCRVGDLKPGWNEIVPLKERRAMIRAWIAAYGSSPVV